MQNSQILSGSGEKLQTIGLRFTCTYPAFKQQTVSLRVVNALTVTFHIYSSSEETHGYRQKTYTSKNKLHGAQERIG